MATKKTKKVIRQRIEQTKKRTALFVLPKLENQYRPHLIRRYGLMLVIAIAIGLQFGYNFTQTGSVLGRVINITSTGLLASTNAERATAEVSSLKISDKLSLAAEQKAKDIIDNQYWDHISPEGVEPWDWLDEVGYNYEIAGENLAKNFTTAGGVVSGWMNSKTHRENMLNPRFTEVGFATVSGDLNGKPATVTVALYAKPDHAISVLPTSSQVVSAASGVSQDNARLSVVARVGIAIQSLTPAAITSLALLFVAATISTTAHVYRQKLPKHLRKTWYKEHGIIKTSGLLTIAAFIILLYGGGQL